MIKSLLLAYALASTIVVGKNIRSSPVWSKSYHVKGTIRLPYASINEPFEAFVDKSVEGKGKSRIDYYGGVTKTFQWDETRDGMGEFGDFWKISPQTTEEIWNEMECFHKPGTWDQPSKAQDVLPTMNDFEFVSYGDLDSTSVCTKSSPCEKWVYQDTKYPEKVSTYTVWIQRQESEPVPVRYEVVGYNVLLQSHYDHWIMDYDFYEPAVHDEHIFDATAQVSRPCIGFPGPGANTYVFNPMAEFVHGETKHVDEEFQAFVDNHQKEYRHDIDKLAKKDIFRHNMRLIHSINRQNLTYKLAPNHLTDTSEEERMHMNGRMGRSRPMHGIDLRNTAKLFKYNREDVEDLPSELNWVKEGAVFPPKDQASCGSCWSFATTGTLEGSYFLKTGDLVRLSEQALMDCSWGMGNNGCDGGEEWRAFEWIMKHGGLPTDETYGPFLGIDGRCHFNDSNVEMKFGIDHYVNVTKQDKLALKVALNKYGPISVNVDASPSTFTFYSSGVWHDAKCTYDGTLDHSVLLVGYGQENGKDYWLIKNSWSTYWGDGGYIKIALEPNDCGIATSASYAVLKDL